VGRFLFSVADSQRFSSLPNLDFQPDVGRADVYPVFKVAKWANTDIETRQIRHDIVNL
jgi:hypothetical protein